jgi:hypothetical protein
MRNISPGKPNTYVFERRGEQDHVRFWHLADIDIDNENVCFWG